MAALLGVDVDRTISMTFVIGAALAAVAGMMCLLYYGVVDFFMGFVAGIERLTAAVLEASAPCPAPCSAALRIGLIETFWSAYFSSEYKDVAAFSILIIVLIFLPTGLLGRPEVEKVEVTRGASFTSTTRAPSRQSRVETGPGIHLQEGDPERACRARSVFADDRRPHRGRACGAAHLLDCASVTLRPWLLSCSSAASR